jgi:DNA-binding LacI/PurR family transcriptional regulator
MSTLTDSKSAPGVPKYQRLALQIRERITSGELQPGHRLPTFVEMRDRFGATATTVMRMYEMLEREGLITRTHGSGVYVAPPQSAEKTGTVGFVVSTSIQHHPYYVHLLEGVRREAELADMEVLLLGEKASIRWEKIDGVIYPVSANDYLHTLNIPPGLARVALIHAHPYLDSVVADDYVGMTQGMEHLRQLGHRRIAFLTLEMQPHSASHQRTPAYQDALRSWGIEPQAAWMRCLGDPGQRGRIWEQTGYDDMKQWLGEDWSTLGCTAILAHNDETAVGMIAALQEAGLRVPQDVSVIGFDGTEIARYHRPRLTTVRVPLAEIGAHGFELLLQQVNRPLSEISQERSRARLSLSTQLQIGQSTAPAPGTKQ